MGWSGGGGLLWIEANMLQVFGPSIEPRDYRKRRSLLVLMRESCRRGCRERRERGEHVASNMDDDSLGI
jgi:hypothetical protein